MLSIVVCCLLFVVIVQCVNCLLFFGVVGGRALLFVVVRCVLFVV